jgi:hypothetical protein
MKPTGEATKFFAIMLAIMTVLTLIISLTSGHWEPFVASIILDVFVGLILVVFGLMDGEWP